MPRDGDCLVLPSVSPNRVFVTDFVSSSKPSFSRDRLRRSFRPSQITPEVKSGGRSLLSTSCVVFCPVTSCFLCVSSCPCYRCVQSLQSRPSTNVRRKVCSIPLAERINRFGKMLPAGDHRQLRVRVAVQLNRDRTSSYAAPWGEKRARFTGSGR